MAAEVTEEKVLYLLDPVGASRRPRAMRLADKLIGACGLAKHDAIELPYTPEFLHKEDGLVLSIGQFNQWVGQQLMMSGLVQIWPGSPVSAPISIGDGVTGVRLMDQGVEKDGTPAAAFMPGMDVKAALTVVGDGPLGPVGRKLDEHFGMPEGHRSTNGPSG